jgi:hypothetical protein
VKHPLYVGCLGQSGLAMLGESFSEYDPKQTWNGCGRYDSMGYVLPDIQAPFANSGAHWRLMLDEGYRTDRHATPQAALQQAIPWIDSQKALMTIDDIIGHLSDRKIFQPAWINNRDVTKWSEATGLSRSALYDAIALRLAFGFQCNTFEFGFCDRIVNDLLAVMSAQLEDSPELFWNVFLAFDSGEFYPNNDRSIDPVEAFTRPQIAAILRKHITD